MEVCEYLQKVRAQNVILFAAHKSSTIHQAYFKLKIWKRGAIISPTHSHCIIEKGGKYKTQYLQYHSTQIKQNLLSLFWIQNFKKGGGEVALMYVQF